MKKVKKTEMIRCGHEFGCSCTPPLFVDMFEKVGRDLSRRNFIKGASAVVGMFALGSLPLPLHTEYPSLWIRTPWLMPFTMEDQS